jgi:hypothetical protein
MKKKITVVGAGNVGASARSVALDSDPRLFFLFDFPLMIS